MPTRSKGLLSSPDNELAGIEELGKAVYDAVIDGLPEHVGKALEPHVEGVKAGVAALVGQLVAKELEGRIARLEDSYRHDLAETVGQVKELMAQYDVMRAETAKAYAEGQAELKSLLKSLPVPQVNVEVPENAIRVDQLPANVTVQAPSVSVSVPENAIQLQQPSIVNNFAVPKDSIKLQGIKIEHKMAKDAINVTVEQPKRKVISEKSIVYGGDGRPEKIVETTSEE